MRYYNHYSCGNTLEILFSIMVIISVIYLVTLIFRKKASISRFICNRRVVNILSERYARGEISQEEYEHKLKVIKGIKI